MGAQRGNTDPDAWIARLAANQHGVVSTEQLASAGINKRGRERRVSARRLHRIHRGVFALGHRGLSREGWWMAAVLACGPGAVLSHVSAGRLWGMVRSSRPLSPAQSGRTLTHITVARNARNRAGIRVHRSRTLFPSQVTLRLGIPVTTPSRTLADLHRIVPHHQFAAALREAEFLGLPLEPALEPDHTRSELEARFLALCRRHRLPKPDVNVRAGPFVVDFLWPDEALVVELDGYGAHGIRSAFETDRSRDAQLTALGFRVVRFTWRQLIGDRTASAARLRELLAARRK